MSCVFVKYYGPLGFLGGSGRAMAFMDYATRIVKVTNIHRGSK